MVGSGGFGAKSGGFGGGFGLFRWVRVGPAFIINDFLRSYKCVFRVYFIIFVEIYKSI